MDKRIHNTLKRALLWALFISTIPFNAAAFFTEAGLQEYKDHIIEVVEDGECEDPEEMSRLIAYYGLSGLDQTYLDLVRENFKLFSPILAASQQPPLVPNCWVQAFCRQHANASQREEMLVALRAWLIEDIPEAQTGNMAGSDPAFIVQGVLEAAECLVEWRDTSSASLIGEYLLREKIHENFRKQFEVLEMRLRDPCQQSLFQVLPNGQALVCLKPEDLPNIELQSCDFRNTGRSVYVLSENEKIELVTLINNSQVSINLAKGGAGKSHYFVLRFENAYQACIQIPSNGTESIFYDNGPSEFCPHVILKNEDLYRWGKNLINERTSKPNK